MNRLLLVRHGETRWNAEERLQGRADIELSPRGDEQVRAVLPLVAADHPGYVVNSPLVRAKQTAKILGLGELHDDARWQEADLGAWTGCTKAEVTRESAADYRNWRGGTFTPPHGEPFGEVLDRVRAALADLAELPGADTVLVVTHGGPIRAVCHLLLGLRPAQLAPVQPGSLTAFDFTTPVPRLAAYSALPVASTMCDLD